MRLKILAVLALATLLPSLAFSADETFSKTKVRFSKDKDRVMVDKEIDLTFQDTEQRLVTRGEHKPVSIPYGQAQQVVFDVNTHMRGGGMSQVVGGIVGAAMAAKHVQDYWCYVVYKTEAGAAATYLMEVDRESAEAVINKMKSVFGDKVSVTQFEETFAAIEKDTLKDLQSKHSVEVNKKGHELPEIKPEKALVVVACPSLAARYAGKGIQFKLHANDQVVLVNKWGTYSYAYLEPGEYTLASQSENAHGTKMRLEAGKDYYFFQNTFMGAWKAKTGLSRQSKERVLAEIEGSYLSDWKRK
jgi:hypothetical protein